MTTSSKYVNGNTTSRQCVTKVQILLAPFNSSNHLMRRERLYILKQMLSALLELYKSVGRQVLKVGKKIKSVRWEAVGRHHSWRRWTTKTKSRFALGIQIRVSYHSYDSLNPSGMRVIETAHPTFL